MPQMCVGRLSGTLTSVIKIKVVNATVARDTTYMHVPVTNCDQSTCMSYHIYYHIYIIYYLYMSNRQNQQKTKVIGSGLGMFNCLPKPSQPIGDHPFTYNTYIYIYIHLSLHARFPTIADRPLQPCAFRGQYREIVCCAIYVYIIQLVILYIYVMI